MRKLHVSLKRVSSNEWADGPGTLDCGGGHAYCKGSGNAAKVGHKPG